MIRAMPLTRRSFAGGLAATAALICCPACRARAQGKAMAQSAPQVLCAAASGGVPEPEALLDTSGDANLDRILAAEMIEQARFFGLRPAFRLYKGGAENAFATTQTDLPGTQGTIMYQLGLLRGQLTSSKWGGAVVSGIIAHEFGHIYQFNTDYAKRLQALHKTVKFQELHADYMSAFYMAKKHVASQVNLKDYFDAFYDLGDYGFNDKDHHGTKEERYFAVKSGHNLSLMQGGEGIAFAAAQGEALLKEYFR